MATLLKQSTTVTVRLGPFLDNVDGVTEETGITPVVEVSKNNGAFGARNSATAITHDSNGWYAVEIDTTDTGTLGPMIIKSDSAAVFLPVWREFMVIPANVYNSLVAGSDYLDVEVAAMANNTITAAAIATGAIDADAIADNAIDAGAIATGAIDADAIADDAIDAGALKADAVTEIAAGITIPSAASIADAVWDELSTGHTDAGKAGAMLWTAIADIQTPGNQSRRQLTDG